MSGVTRHVDGGVLHLRLDRPDKLNALTTSMLRALHAGVVVAADDPSITAVALTGAGSSFCAGGDLSGRDTDGAGESASELIRSITEIPKPVVAGVRGAASGVGCALALACDLVVAAHSSFFHLAFMGVGLVPDGGTSTLLSAAIGRARAARLILLAERLPARQAFDWGMISHVVDDDSFDADFEALIAAVAAGPTAAYGLSKQALREATLPTLTQVQQLELSSQRTLVDTDYFRRAVAAFRRGPRARGTHAPSTDSEENQ